MEAGSTPPKSAKEAQARTAEVLRPKGVERRNLPTGTDLYSRINRTAETWLDKQIVSLRAAIPVRLTNFSARKAHGWNDEAANLKASLQDIDQQISEAKVGDLRLLGLGGSENRTEMARLQQERASIAARYNKAEEKTRTWTGRQDRFEAWTRRQTDPFIERLNKQREPFDLRARALGARAAEIQGVLDSIQGKRQKALAAYEEKLTKLQGAMSPENEKRFKESILPAFRIMMAKFDAEEKNALRAKADADKKLNVLRKTTRPLDKYSKNTALWIQGRVQPGVNELPQGLNVSAPGRVDTRSTYAGTTGLGSADTSAPRSAPRAAAAPGEAFPNLDAFDDNFQISCKDLFKAWAEMFDGASDIKLDDRKIWDAVFDVRGITDPAARDAEYQKIIDGDEKFRLIDIQNELLEAAKNPDSPLHALAADDATREDIVHTQLEDAAAYHILNA